MNAVMAMGTQAVVTIYEDGRWVMLVRRDKVAELLSEVDCRIEHGAESGGHLEYVHRELQKILGAEVA
jgi:hypothetical protein